MDRTTDRHKTIWFNRFIEVARKSVQIFSNDRQIANAIRCAAMNLTLGFLVSSNANAAPVIWTDWTSGVSGAVGSAEGTLDIDSTIVSVSYSGEAAFIQTDSGADYWTPSGAYVSPTVDNPPLGPDIIALSQASAKSISFSQPIANPLFAVVSLNGNGYRFDRDFEILSFGPGYWGNGTLSKEVLGGGLFQLNGSGEPHGVIEFQGTFSSVTWTSLTNEHWNGFTIGVRGLAVPEPSSLTLATVGAIGLVQLVRRRRKS